MKWVIGQCHIDSGDRCKLKHYGPKGVTLPPCFRCSICDEWIAPEVMIEPCPGPSEVPVTTNGL
jgi:hypothetical protein